MKEKLESLKGTITDAQLAEIIRKAEYRYQEHIKQLTLF